MAALGPGHGNRQAGPRARGRVAESDRHVDRRDERTGDGVVGPGQDGQVEAPALRRCRSREDAGPAGRVGPGGQRGEGQRERRLDGGAMTRSRRRALRDRIADVRAGPGPSEGRHGRQGQQHVAQMVGAGQEDPRAGWWRGIGHARPPVPGRGLRLSGPRVPAPRSSA